MAVFLLREAETSLGLKDSELSDSATGGDRHAGILHPTGLPAFARRSSAKGREDSDFLLHRAARLPASGGSGTVGVIGYSPGPLRA